MSGLDPARVAVMVEAPVTGAGADAARLLRERGLSTLLLTHDPDGMPQYLRRQLAQQNVSVIQTSTLDVEAMRASVLQNLDGSPRAVLGMYEYYAAQAAELAREFGCPGPAPEAVAICRDKARQRDQLAGTEITVHYRRCHTADQAQSAAAELGTPVIVKPTNLTGSVLVRRCDTPHEAKEAAEAILRQGEYLGIPVQNEVLVEEFIEGAEYSVELMHGRAVAVTSKTLAPGTVIEISHTVPAGLATELQDYLSRVAEEACSVIGLGWGPAHVELRVQESGRAAVIEINARVAGDRIPELVRLATGVDLVDEHIGAALGEAARRGEPEAPVATIRFRQGPGGRLNRVSKLESARAIADVREVHLRIAEGQEHRLNGSNQDRVAWAIATGDVEAAARTAATQALDTVELDWARMQGTTP